MDDRQLTLFLIALFAMVLPLMIVATLWTVSRLRKKSDQPLAPDGAGGIHVPVRALRRDFRFFGYSHNSLNPRLEIGPDGLHFRLLKPDHWRFADIERVDVPTSLFGTRLVVHHREEGDLTVNLADLDRACALLRALPDTIAFSPRAASLRRGPA